VKATLDLSKANFFLMFLLSIIFRKWEKSSERKHQSTVYILGQLALEGGLISECFSFWLNSSQKVPNHYLERLFLGG
jgi:hypothetical protein